MSIHSIPALHDSNAGRPGWTIAAEALALAKAGSNGLAGIILAHGFSPAKPVSVAKNTDGLSLAILASEVLRGLDQHKSKSGEPMALILASDAEGKPVKVTLDQIRAAIVEADPQDIVPPMAIPAGGDGRRRTVAYFIATVYALACKRTMGPMTTVMAGSDKASDALAGNLLDSYRSALGPWQKVLATVDVVKGRPSITEAEVQAVCGAKRGDAQLMHRAAVAIIKHGLAVDTAGRCPGKEEWPAIRDCATSEEAQALLATVVASVRPKAVGVDKWASALAMLPEGTTLDGRALAQAMEAGTEEALAALLTPLMK